MTPPARLPRTLKGALPFRLATTSFIYPDRMLANVRRLSPFFDEIELLFLESTSRSLPGAGEIAALGELACEHGLTYNVHLPIDVRPTSEDAAERSRAWRRITRVMTLTADLHPTTFTLHLPCENRPQEMQARKGWDARLQEELSALLRRAASPQEISVETLMFPFEWVLPVVERLDLRICLDVGHLLLNQRDPVAFFNRHAARIAIVHLHGVENGRDHLALDRLPNSLFKHLWRALSGFRGTVSLEVFSLENLIASLQLLVRHLR